MHIETLEENSRPRTRAEKRAVLTREVSPITYDEKDDGRHQLGGRGGGSKSVFFTLITITRQRWIQGGEGVEREPDEEEGERKKSINEWVNPYFCVFTSVLSRGRGVGKKSKTQSRRATAMCVCVCVCVCVCARGHEVCRKKSRSNGFVSSA